MSEWGVVERYLRRIADSDAITEDHLAAAGGFEASSGLTDEMVETWARFRSGAPLTPPEKRDLEAIVLPNGLRPSFDVRDDSFAELPEPWSSINAHRPFVETCIRAIGRVNIPGHATLQYAGTGFIVGEHAMLTNRHVADVFCETGSTSLRFIPGIVPSLDLKQEVANPASVIVTIASLAFVSADWDAALFRVENVPATVTPLRLSAQPPAALESRLAAIVGYPALDSRGSTEEVLRQIKIFRAVFDKKRLQPGRLLGRRDTVSFGRTVNALGHDCSTLGGNSGSALIDVEAEAVAGLHFGGQYLVANYAVPAWELAGDRRMRDEGVSFI